jgi:hypoxanthine-DNA glycosylase
MTRLVGLPPVIGPQTRLLVLGSFPGLASLREQRYYGHPRNQFWKILSALWSVELVSMGYHARLDEVRSRGLGIWDVYAACEREGSLDADIRHAELNDFARLQRECPSLQAIAHNGGESFRHARHTQALGLPVHQLPSTSPANASWSVERKLAAWRDVFALYSLA